MRKGRGKKKAGTHQRARGKAIDRWGKMPLGKKTRKTNRVANRKRIKQARL